MGSECEQFEGRSRDICEGKVYDERQTRIWRARRGLDSPGEPKERRVSEIVAKVPPKPLQLGDAVERALTAVGITSERVTKFLGKECGCAERKRKLNQLGDWAASFFAGKQTPIEDIIGPVKKKIDVAVVITSHNYGNYLAECLMSVENQTERPAEVIVVDDASDEWDTAKQIASERGVKYLRVENRNVYLTRRDGLNATQSPFVVFLDADDAIEPTYLAECLTMMKRDERTAIVTSGMTKFGDATGIVNHAEMNIERQNWIHAGSMVRRLAIETTRAFDQPKPGTQSHADWYVWRTILRGGWDAKRISSASYRYRIHGDSMMRTKAGETYYDEASLATEPITLVLPLSGREQYWGRLIEWVRKQTRITDVLVIDTSSDPKFREAVRLWLACLSVRSTKYVSLPPSHGLADLDRRGLGQEYRGVQKAMPLIYEHMRSGVTTEFVFIVEDDVLPPVDAIDKTLRAMQPNVAAVSGVVMSRWSDKGHVIAHDHKRQTINLAESTGGVQSVGGTGFGCLLLRRSAMLQATPFHHGGLTGNFDMEFASRLRASGWQWLMDWSIDCVHGDGTGSSTITPSLAR